MPKESNYLPFCARYSLPTQVSETLGEVSWETVVQMSTDFHIKTKAKRSNVKKIIKELQMSRIILMEKIKHCSKDGRIDPKVLVMAVKLLQKCEKFAKQYDIDLDDFSRYIYLVSEKIKKEKLARHKGPKLSSSMHPIKEELFHFKDQSEIYDKKPKKNNKEKKERLKSITDQ